MQNSCSCQTGQRPPGKDTVEPSAAENGPYISNPVGYTFVMREIAERNPIVRHALMRRAEIQMR